MTIRHHRHCPSYGLDFKTRDAECTCRPDPILESAERISTGERPDGPPAPGPVTVRLADVEPERVTWLWPGRLPLGKLVVLDGDPAVGKSTLAVDWAARVTTGHAWPDGAHCPRGAVLLLSAEDGLADTIRPRLDAAGGDPARMHALTEIRYDDAGTTRTRPPTLADLEHIESVVKSTASVLVIIDVLMAYLPGKIDAHRDQDVRGVLSGLAAMAERTGCVVLLLRHLNKAAGGSALYRGGGSIGIIGAARVGLLAAVDPDDETQRVLAGLKCNLAALPDALAYQLVDAPEHGCARVQWLGTSDHSAGALLALRGGDDEREQADELVTFLRMVLDDTGGEIAAGEAMKRLRAEGMTPSKDTLFRARKRAGIESRKSDLRGGWIWSYGPEGSGNPSQGSEGSASQTGRTFRTFAEPSQAGDEAAAPCGHPLSATNTYNGQCGMCIAERVNRGADT